MDTGCDDQYRMYVWKNGGGSTFNVWVRVRVRVKVTMKVRVGVRGRARAEG